MKLTINGEQHNVPETISSVMDLLHHFQLEQKVLIVELNETIIENTVHSETILSNGDRIEIVHFVGGG